MKFSQDYVLVLDERQQQLATPDFSAVSRHCSFIVAVSPEHAVEQARQVTPCLVILVGEDHAWFKHQVNALRHSADEEAITIVALTDSTSPSWESEENLLDLDGFLVEPLTEDVLTSLVESAIVKHSYR